MAAVETIEEHVQCWLKGIECGGDRVLGLVGPAGVGKTAVLYSFCEQHVEEVCANYFFHYDGSHSQNKASHSVRQALLSIADQLAKVIPDFPPVSDETSLDQIGDVKSLFRTLLSHPLQKVRRRQQRVNLVVLDALDEAQERESLLEIVTTLWQKEMPHWLALLFSARPFCDLQNSPAQLFAMTYECNEMHLSSFTRQRLSAVGMKGNELDEAVRIIVEESGGWFLLVHGILDRLKGAENISLRYVCDVLDSQEACDTVHKRYFSRLLHYTLRGDHDTYQRLLSVVAVSRFPVSEDLIAFVLEGEDVEAVVRLAGELLVVTPGGSIHFPHRTMASFLTSKRRAGKDLFVQSRSGHQSLADYLSKETTSPISLRHLMYHLAQQKQWDRVGSLLSDYEWLSHLVKANGATRGVVSDLQCCNDLSPLHENARVVLHALALALDTLELYPDLLPFELVARLPPSHPLVDLCRERVDSNPFLPTTACFQAYSDGLCKVLRPHSSERLASSSVLENNVAACTSDGKMYVWDWRTGELIQTWKCADASNEAPAVTLTSDAVVSCGAWGDTTIIWEKRFGARLVEMNEASNVLAADGNVFVSIAPHRNKIRVCDSGSGACVQVLEGGTTDPFQTVVIHHDTVASLTANGVVRVWKWPTGACIQEFQVGWNAAIALDIKTVATGVSNDVQLWDVDCGKCQHSLKGHVASITSLSLGEDRVVSGSGDETVRVWERHSGLCLHVLQGHTDGILFVSIQDDNVVSVCPYSISVWDLSRCSVLDQKKKDLADTELVFATVASDGRLALGYVDGVVRLRDVCGDRQRFSQEFQSPSSCKFLSFLGFTNTQIVAVYGNGMVLLWDVDSPKPVRSFSIVETGPKFLATTVRRWLLMDKFGRHEKNVSCVAVSGALATGSYDCSVRLWDLKRGVCFRVLEGHTWKVEDVAMDEQTVVSVSIDNTVRVWDRETGQCLHRFHPKAKPLAVKGDVVVGGSSTKGLLVWNKDSGVCLYEADQQSWSEVVAIVVRHDSSIWFACLDRTIRVVRRDTQQQFSTCKVFAKVDDRIVSFDVGEIGDRMYAVVVVLGRTEPIILSASKLDY